MKKEINCIKDFANLLNSETNISNDDIEVIIAEKGWYDLTFADCLDEECTLHSICSDGKNMIIYNSESNKFSVIPDSQKRKIYEPGKTHKEKLTVMKLKGIKKAVSELKGAQFGRIYVNINTFEVVALRCISSTSGYLNSDDLREVCTYNAHYEHLSMAWVKEQIEEYLHRNRLI